MLTNNQKQGQQNLLALLLYTIITLLFFHKYLPFLTDSLIGRADDNMEFIWNMWWAKKAMFDPSKSLFYSDYTLYPGGHSLWLHTMSWFNTILSVPLQSFLSLPLIYNLLILSTFIIGGFSAFLLTRHLTKNSFVSLVSGFIFAFNPWHFTHSLVHLNIASIQFLPLFALYYLKYSESKSTKHLWCSILFFALNALCSWYFMMYALLYLAADMLYFSYTTLFTGKYDRYFLFSLIPLMIVLPILLLIPVAYFLIKAFYRIKEDKSLIGQLLKKANEIFTVSLLSLVVLSPLIIFMVGDVIFNEIPRGYTGGDNLSSMDLLGFLIPNFSHFIWGDSIISFMSNTFASGSFVLNPDEEVGFLGFFNIFLLIVCFRKIKEKKYLFLFLFFLLFAMGKELHIGGFALESSMLPYALLLKIPLFKIPSDPPTAMILVYLFMGILVASILKGFFDNLKNSSKNQSFVKVGAVGMMVFSVIFLEFYSDRFIKSDYKVPKVFNQIQSQGDDFGVLIMPDMFMPIYREKGKNTERYAFESKYKMYQTIHEIPMKNYSLSRIYSDKLIEKIYFLTDVFGNSDKFKDTLKREKIKYIIVDRKYFQIKVEGSEKRVIDEFRDKFNLVYSDDESLLFQNY